MCFFNNLLIDFLPVLQECCNLARKICDKISANREKKQIYLVFSKVQPNLSKVVFYPYFKLSKTVFDMEDNLSKKFYRIGDVAEILGVPASTLRFWEKEFTVIKPKRNAKNIRVYTAKDIETIKMIYYLVKEKGLKLDAAQAMIKRNRDGINKQHEVVERLKNVKEELLKLENALSSLKP
jgi:DNA-binding transcriptional MerR regulator